MEEWKLQPARDLGLPLRQRFRSLDRESGPLESALHIAWWTGMACYLKLFHRLEVTGRDQLPSRPPFVVISNHSSHLDALVLGAALDWRTRDCVYPLAAGDTFFESLPSSAFAALMLNALPIWRKGFDPRDIQALRQRLLDGPCAYILFPEGTRSRDGRMTRFRRGIGMLVAETAVPVVPCHLEGAYQAWPAQRKLPVLGKLRLTVGRPLDFSGVKNDVDGWTRVAAEAESAVVRLKGT
jgi:1-acyl-sn-glycerol-3-phosphate acyltransferase